MKYIVYNVDEQEKIAEFESMDMMMAFMKAVIEANMVQNFQIQCIQGKWRRAIVNSSFLLG